MPTTPTTPVALPVPFLLLGLDVRVEVVQSRRTHRRRTEGVGLEENENASSKITNKMRMNTKTKSIKHIKVWDFKRNSNLYQFK
jgi:hypothetical protein